MTEEAKEKTPQAEAKTKIPNVPLVFISHDARDCELADAFSKLLRSVSAGMLKSFRSSDKKGTEGIEFGDEWYKRLMKKLESASVVVCLLTERSFERPWILYEAGVAKGKLDKPVFGVALGIPLSKVSVGPFYQFQNSDDTEESLTKLIMQLARRVPELEPDPDVVKAQVGAFKAQVSEILAELGESSEEEETPSESSTARVLEELKGIVRDMPSRLERRLSVPELPARRYKIHRYNPILSHKFMRPDDPIAILMQTSFLRDEAPYLEVLARELCDAMHSRNRTRKERAIRLLRRAVEFIAHEPLSEELAEGFEEYRMVIHDLQRSLDYIDRRMGESKNEE